MASNYLTPAELPTYYDERRILQLASDDGVPADLADLSNTGTSAYRFVNSGILWAASEIDSHCQQGKRYSRADLEAIVTEALAATSDGTKQKRAALIRQLTADLAFGQLVSRRGYTGQSLTMFAPRYEPALATLEKLALGLQVFDLDGPINAGAPSRVGIGSQGNYRPSMNNKMFGVWPDLPYNTYWNNQFGRW